MTEKPGLPVQGAVAPRICLQLGREIREEAQGHTAVAGNGLMAADGAHHAASVCLDQAPEGQMRWRARNVVPGEIRAQHPAQRAFRVRPARQGIEPGASP